MTSSTVQITSPVFRSLFTPELKVLSEMFKERGFELRIAGGAVRDILMNIVPVDIDLATTATPDQMKLMFQENEIRMINVGGEKHGTVTARINDQENYEITTLRIDKVTDGRFAEVEFTRDWVVDANRRDLTINSMFLDLEGNLFDFFNGSEDLQKRVIRFVGEPDKRIQEDYLRILRYFRFFGRISNGPDDHVPETLAAIARNVEGLERISGERLWTELRQIMVGRFGDSVIVKMMDTGVAAHLGLPAQLNVEELDVVWKRCHAMKPKPITIITALLHSEEDINKLDERLKLSNEECSLGVFILRHRFNPALLDFCKSNSNADPFFPYRRLLAEEMLNLPKPNWAKSHCIELLKYRGDSVLLQAMEEFEVPKFPVTGHRLLAIEAVPKGGRQTAHVLHSLRAAWIRSDFTRTEDELLTVDLPVILHNLQHQTEERGEKKPKKARNKNCS
ncbi:CCA tRNA nucleotidyltransferase 1, mitochondrial [Hypsibius exemplaris]|uniref:CCA tRNA nucleotidyltransferase 1, mitochondrial n=1 Tax=Hypsibius exemplaris TaxID=2072580 RepID=A0A1W0WVH1_HYPEX|nr:CCA tRNA nucleotidyltransferase 1, mitochondrial [Hypsibius exemplaris]